MIHALDIDVRDIAYTPTMIELVLITAFGQILVALAT